MNFIKIKLHVLSPVNIGCDEVYEPTGFIIDQERKALIEFDPIEFVQSLSPRKRQDFSGVCSGDNLLPVFKFIKNNYTPLPGSRDVEIVPELIAHYQKVITMSSYSKDAVINQFTMNRTAFNLQTNRPYVPGSSLKGAIRTAYLSGLAGAGDYENLSKYLEGTASLEGAVRGYAGKASELEKELLRGSFSEDPFSALKIADLLPTDRVMTKILYAVNKKKRPSDRETKAQSGPPQILEVLMPGSVFEGTIRVEASLSRIKNPLDREKLLLAINKHYSRVYNRELAVKKELGFMMPSLDDFREAQKKTAFLLRLGRHSGSEAVTIESNRKIKIMQGPGQPAIVKEEATTIWLATDERKGNINVMIPFGWAMLQIMES
jgi:CRISPR-associated protein Csm5